MRTTNLAKSVLILALLFLITAGLVLAKEFLIPLAFAGILSMLFLPLSIRLERRGMHRGIAVTICILLFVLIVGGIIALLGWQISDLAEDISKAKGNINSTIKDIRQYISESLGITQQQQEEIIKEQQSPANGGEVAKTILSGIGSVVTNSILALAYVFLLLYFRTRVKKFILKLTPEQEHQKACKIMYDSSHVSQKYLTGLFMMIGCLWIMYGIGFSIIGLKHAIFFAVLCGTLEIVPFVGNLTGTSIALLMALTQGGGSGLIIGVIVTYAIVQFVQSYLLEPLVVASEVDINPLFTIIGLVLGEILWGIPGMVMAIPLMGIGKIICDNIEPLKPYGYLVGQKHKEGGLKDKVKKAFKKSS